MLYTLIELDPIVVVIRRGAKGLDSSSIRLRVNVFAMMSALGWIFKILALAIIGSGRMSVQVKVSPDQSEVIGFNRGLRARSFDDHQKSPCPSLNSVDQ